MIIAVFLLMLMYPSVSHALCTGASPSWSCPLENNLTSLKALIESNSPGTVQDGDTVTVASGNVTTNARVVFPAKSFSLIGAGIGQSIISSSDNSGDGCVFDVTTKATGNTPPGFMRVSGFELGCTAGAQGYAGGGIIAIRGDSHALRLDHIKITTTTTNGISAPSGGVWGVMDHMEFVNQCCHSITWQHLNYDGTEVPPDWVPGAPVGDTSWATADSLGQAGNMYIEDSTFTNTGGVGKQACSDDHGGSRTVYRFNTMVDCTFHIHGTETSGRLRGARHLELYRNTASMSLALTNNYPFISNRGSSGVYFDNVLTGNFADGSGSAPYGIISLNTYRRNDPISSHSDGSTPYGRCGDFTATAASTSFDGTNTTVTLTFNTGVVYSYASQNNLYVTYQTFTGATPSAYNGTFATAGICNGGSDPCENNPNTTQIKYKVSGNPGSITVLPSMKSPFDTPLSGYAGGYRCLDQAGAGTSILYKGFQPNYTPDINPLTPANNILFPVRQWNNTLNGTQQSINNTDGIAFTDVIVENREYFNPNGSCTGSSCTAGIGQGTTLPTACTPILDALNSQSVGPLYWKTNEGSWNQAAGAPGGQGVLYKCTTGGGWAVVYTPYTYPHPLVTAGSGSTASASITSPSAGSIQAAGATFTVSGTATAGNGSLSNVSVYIDGALTCQDTVTPWTTWTCNATAPATAGTYTLTAKATDADGQGPASTGVDFSVRVKKLKLR